MAHPDQSHWKQSWRDQSISCHHAQVQPLLVRFWPTLLLPTDARVFVPLCGKSLDLGWLHAQGHTVIGVELSPVAVHDWFAEYGLQARRLSQRGFTRWSAARISIFCGDFFRLKASDLVGVRAVYDHAALTALPASLRQRYVNHLAAIMPTDCDILLLTVEDLDLDESAADASAVSMDICALYQTAFRIELLYASVTTDISDGDETARSVQKAYRLRHSG